MQKMDVNDEPATLVQPVTSDVANDSDDELWDEYTLYGAAFTTVQQTLTAICSHTNSSQTILFGSLVCNNGCLSTVVSDLIRRLTVQNLSLVLVQYLTEFNQDRS